LVFEQTFSFIKEKINFPGLKIRRNSRKEDQFLTQPDFFKPREIPFKIEK